MAATIEIKYFNSFWLKKMDSIVDVVPTTGVTSAITALASTTITLNKKDTRIGVGQSFTYIVSSTLYSGVVKMVEYPTITSTKITLIAPTTVSIPATTTITFTNITDFQYIPNAYAKGASDWDVEEARIRGGYNNLSVDFGVKAYLVEDSPRQQYRPNAMIYSGIFNSRTGINNTNQFSVAEDITRGVDPAYGSIQKLYAEDTNLIIFQESKVSRALIDKDAIYSAEGQPMTTSGAAVIGQIQQYAGNYGISTNPESFAVYGYRKYFVDKNQNVVLRLSQDGITEISANGMIDYFRDNLALIGSSGKLIGGWDMHNKQYVLSMQPAGTAEYQTLAFDESCLGWTSRFSYKPNLSGSLRNNFYTFKNGNIWLHYADTSLVNYCKFYNVQYDANVTLIFNPEVSMSKNFNTLNYEGSGGWILESLYSDTDTARPISKSVNMTSLVDLQNQLFMNSFKNKENKYFGTIINNTPASSGEIIYGNKMNGIKGFYTTVKMTFINPTTPQAAELYAVSSNYVKSSY